MTLTPADHALLARLLLAEQEPSAERIRYVADSNLGRRHLIAEGPNGWAYLTNGGRAIAQGSELAEPREVAQVSHEPMLKDWQRRGE